MRRHLTKESLLAFWAGLKGFMRRHLTKESLLAYLVGFTIVFYLDDWWPRIGALVTSGIIYMVYTHRKDKGSGTPPTNEGSDSHDPRMT